MVGDDERVESGVERVSGKEKSERKVGDEALHLGNEAVHSRKAGMERRQA